MRYDGQSDLWPWLAGTPCHLPGYELRIEVHEAGSVRLPSGRLVAADPSSLDYDVKPFTVTVSPGAYPVWLGRDEAGEVVCFVADMLLFNEE